MRKATIIEDLEEKLKQNDCSIQETTVYFDSTMTKQNRIAFYAWCEKNGKDIGVSVDYPGTITNEEGERLAEIINAHVAQFGSRQWT